MSIPILSKLIDHETAVYQLDLFAEILGIDIPTDEKYVRFFLTRLKESIQNGQKKVNAMQIIEDAHKLLHGGR